MTAQSSTKSSALNLNSLPLALLASLAAAALILVLRFLGLFQPLELTAYDALLKSRPAEPLDERILVVKITEEDIRNYKYPLPDPLLAKLLTKIGSHQPQSIGIDIYRDKPEGELAALLKNDGRIVGIAKINASGGYETPPPPGMSVDEGRVGYSDMPLDDDRVIRQSYLYTTLKDGKDEKTIYSFSFLLALSYLDREKVSPQRTASGDMQLGKVTLKQLDSNAGAYQNQKLFDQSYRMLINFRLPAPAREVSAAEILAGKVNPEWIKDKIVLVGYTADSVNDVFNAPYSPTQVAGVIFHAHAISQFLSAGLNNRAMIWYWGEPMEWGWIVLWSVAVGALVWWTKSPLASALSAAIAIVLIIGFCYLLFTKEGWVPLVPTIAGVLLSAVAVRTLRGNPAPVIIEVPVPVITNENPTRNEAFGPNSRSGTVVDGVTANPFARVNWLGRTVGLGDRYLINSRLGEGGMGEVYIALDRTIGRDVALKILRANVNAESLGLQKRFEKEVKVSAALRSNNIVQVNDYGTTVEGFPFYVMELLQGKSLGQVLKKEKCLSLNRSIGIMKQVCEGLSLAHQGITMVSSSGNKELVKVVHRDLKPDNIYLVPIGIGELVKILDFGIAKTVSQTEEDGEDRTDLTMGGFVGTSRYAAPEQWRGQRNLDHRADIYSLGIIFYEMLSGNNPFGIDQEEAYSAPALWYEGHVLREAKPISAQAGCENLSLEVEAIIMRCIAKSPDQRFNSIDELLASLNAIALSP
ncbi:MAG: CHASE2 domain-containing protein [Anaerolineae bacterium]|nr:CHASE2 domain-containing protein [Gloeobacterales cyanobacterium ES-bin-313]